MPRNALPSALVFLPLLASAAMAQGLVIPEDPHLPPLALTRHHVTAVIDRQVAVTTIEQVFLNNTERKLQAHYVFPIPKGAALSRFSLTIDGKPHNGELVEKDKARELYQTLVTRARMPGLLEHIGADAFRASLYPIEPHSTRTLVIRYEQALPAHDGLARYVYPVRYGPMRGPTVHGDFRVEVTIRSASPIRNVYSPSHPVSVQRASDTHVLVSHADKNSTVHRDFQLYYGTGDDALGFDLAAFRPDPERPGTFMLLLSPRPRPEPEARIVERDIVFVVDTSGSMAGEKMRQAREALKYCVTNLNEKDRFAIVEFSTAVQPWKGELVEASERNRAAALAWVDALRARGGTNIAGALETALALPRDPSRPFTVVFMTDGLPTIGETDTRKLLSTVERVQGGAVRFFTWGVGYDVDTHLLDAMADRTGGVAEYVHPEEDIAFKVSSFYAKSSRPVLTGLKLALVEGPGDVQLLDILPRILPDLYAGGQSVVFGRYTGAGAVRLVLTGSVNGREERFEYTANFPQRDEGHTFIEPLWARRQIGHLLDTIRLHGESKELVDDVVRLSIEFGIQTPYTSWVIRGDAGRPTAAAPAGLRGGAAAGRKLDDMARDRAERRPAAGGAQAEPAPAPVPSEARREQDELQQNLAEGFKGKDGKAAVGTSEYLRRLRESGGGAGWGHGATEADKAAPVRRAGNVRLIAYRDCWVDDRFEADMEVTTVRFGSRAYFRLAELRPELARAFAEGTQVLLVTAPGRALLVAEDSGEEDLSDARLSALFH